jgi:hypothetical protein
MTFDRVRRVSVMYGGRVGNEWSDETWEWNGERWTLRTATLNPGARDNGAMTFDETRNEVVLVGGLNDEATWLWNGTRWVTLVGVDAPTQFRGGALAYDRTYGRPLFFGGGTSIEPVTHGGTWELTGTGWIERAPPGVPPPREAFGMAYVDSIAAVVIFGGNRPGTTADRHADLWWWNGVTWREW